MSIRPLAGHVIVATCPKPNQVGGIILGPHKAEATIEAEVLAVGAGISEILQPGVRVIMESMSGHSAQSQEAAADMAALFGIELPRRVVVVRCGNARPAPVQEEALDSIQRQKLDLKKRYQGLPEHKIPETAKAAMDDLLIRERDLKARRKKAGRSRRRAPGLDLGMPEGILAVIEEGP